MGIFYIVRNRTHTLFGNSLKTILFISLVLLFCPVVAKTQDTQKGATKKERELILEGNSLFRQSKFQEALTKYQDAIKENGESNVAAFNSAIAEIQIASSIQGKDSVAGQILQQASELLNRVATRDDKRNNISAKAWYNLGNLAFMGQDYGQAVNMYKSSLRLNPSDNNARRNLRIAQKKQQENKDKNKNQQNQQNHQDKQDQDKQEKQNNQNQQNNTPREQKLDRQTSDRILNAIERKENQIRMKKNANPEQSTPRAGRSYKNW